LNEAVFVLLHSILKGRNGFSNFLTVFQNAVELLCITITKYAKTSLYNYLGIPVVYFGQGRQASCHRRHFDGDAENAWQNLKFVTCGFLNLYFAPFIQPLTVKLHQHSALIWCIGGVALPSPSIRISGGSRGCGLGQVPPQTSVASR